METINISIYVLGMLVLLALVFDFMNGFHDSANSIATIVSTRVLSPRAAVAMAAFFNFIAFAIVGEAVAKTIGGGMVDIKVVPESWRLWVLLCGLLGAITWNLITWYYGLPSSSSHALVGGYAGSAIAAAGFTSIIPSGWAKTLVFIVISPLAGMLFGFLIMVAVLWIFRNWSPGRVDSFFRKGQLVSSALISLSHGGNDAQKTMGIIAGVLVASNLNAGATEDIPFWVEAICYVVIALGTLSGGWRIVKTMGSGITRLQPVGGFCAEAAAASTIIIATQGGIPISTTHAITGAILGVGTTKGVRSVRWIWGQRIVLAWILTIPCAAFMAAICYLLIHFGLEPLMK